MGAIDKDDVKALHTWAGKLSKDAKSAKTPKDAERLNSLAAILKMNKPGMASGM